MIVPVVSCIVSLILRGYNLVTQLFPSLVFSLKKNNRVTKEGTGVGILAGIAIIAYINLTGI